MRVVTLNIWSGLNYKGLIKFGEFETNEIREKRFSILINELKSLKSDIIVLNEVNMVNDYIDRICSILDMDVIYSMGVSGVRVKNYGLPINLKEADVVFAKKGLNLEYIARIHLGGFGIVRNNFSIHFSNLTQALVTKVIIDEKPVYIVATHLLACPDYSEATKKRAEILCSKYRYSKSKLKSTLLKLSKDEKDKNREVKILLKYLSKKLPKDAKIILAGDFNAAPNWDAITKITENGFIDSYQNKNKDDGFTWDPQLNSNLANYYFKDIYTRQKSLYTHLHNLDELENRRIDYIFSKNFSKVKKSKLCMTKKIDGINASDHFGIVSDFEI